MGRSRHPPALSLPEELWVEVASHLGGAELGRFVCTCTSFARIGQHAWRAACFRRWPGWAAIAAEPGAQWRRQYELLALRQAEAGSVPDLERLGRLQQTITERHRSILTEWLCEVRGGGGAGGWGAAMPRLWRQRIAITAPPPPAPRWPLSGS